MTLATDIRRMPAVYHEAELRAADWLARHSIDLLRISLGLVFLGFGVLKFVPGLSPAELLAAQTLDILTFGLVSPIVLLPGEMFRGLFAPTLEGQYVLKDVIVTAAGFVVAARTLGARLVIEGERRADCLSPPRSTSRDAASHPARRLTTRSCDGKCAAQPSPGVQVSSTRRPRHDEPIVAPSRLRRRTRILASASPT